MEGKIKIVSCNFGGDLRPLRVNNPEELKKLGADLVVYDDSNTNSRHLSMQSRLKGKIPKMLEWENGDYDYYIWIDSKFTMNEGIIQELLKPLEGTAELALFSHPNRSSISDELSFMKEEMGLGNHYLNDRYYGEDMDRQVESYLSDNTFIDDKLFACGCFAYKKSLVENKGYNLLKEWFYHNAIYSIQDQLSLPYLLHKFQTDYVTYDFNLLNTHLLKYNYC